MFFYLVLLQHTKSIVDLGTHPLLIPHFLGVIARTNDSQIRFLP